MRFGIKLFIPGMSLTEVNPTVLSQVLEKTLLNPKGDHQIKYWVKYTLTTVLGITNTQGLNEAQLISLHVSIFHFDI